MERDIARRLDEAVHAFNLRASQARRKGLPFTIEAATSRGSSGRSTSYLDVLRSMPLAADLLPKAREDQCVAEINLLSAAKEVNRLAEEARRRNLEIALTVAADERRPGGLRVALVLPVLL